MLHFVCIEKNSFRAVLDVGISKNHGHSFEIPLFSFYHIFSVMDYYKLMNLQADTALRRSIVSGDKQEERETADDDDDDFGDDE